MKLWKLLARLWSSSQAQDARRSEVRRIATVDCLNDGDPLESKSVRTPIAADSKVAGRDRFAEVAYVAARSTVRSQNRFLQLSVVVVDYLLEHEWFGLLAGTRGRRPSRRHEHRRAQSAPRHAAQDDTGVPFDESNRTACVGDSPWSVVTAIDEVPRADSTTRTDSAG